MTRAAAAAPRKVRHLPLTHARINLGSVIRRVRIDKEYVILEKDGLPVAGMMDIDEFEDYLDLRNPEVNRGLAASAKDARAGKTRPAEALLAELRATHTRNRPKAGKNRKHVRV
jgi:PHD/YefM family antitoxin component YafN of YafNO toxin-antitoxin module